MKAYPTYKDSGVQWLSEVPDTWNVFPAKQLFADSKERRRKDDTFLTASQKYGVISQLRYMQLIGGRIVQASQDFDKWKHVEPDDFVISLRSFQGGLEMCTERGCVTWHYVVLKPKVEIIPLYFKWLFKSYSYIKSLQSTCNFIRDGQDLRYSNFVQVPIPVPSLDEQKTISAFLDKKCAEIDELVSRRLAIIERLKELKQSIIAEAVTKGLNPDVPMKDSGIAWLGDVPKHWMILRLKNVASVITDTLSEKTNPDFEFDYVDISSVTQEQGILKTERFKFSNAPSRARRKVQVGDIIISTVRTYLRAIAVISKENENIIASTGFAVVRSKQFSYVAYVMSSHSFVSMVSTLSTGVSYPAITSNKLLRIHIAFPPEEEQQAIVAYLDKKCTEIDELVVRQEQIIEKLKELKTSTIAHVVTGKVDVRDAI